MRCPMRVAWTIVVLSTAAAPSAGEMIYSQRPIRVFSDFDDTIYSSLREKHVTFSSGSDPRQGSNATHGRIYAGVGWLYHAISYRHGGPAGNLWKLLQTVRTPADQQTAASLQDLAAASKKELQALLRVGRPTGGTPGRMDVVLVTARPAQSGEQPEVSDARRLCATDEEHEFGGRKHPGDQKVIDYFADVGEAAGPSEGWGFSKVHGYGFLSLYITGFVRNVLGGILNFVTTADTASPADGTPAQIADRRSTYATLAQMKADFILSWLAHDLDEDFVWFGDNGQGDVCTAALLLQNFSASTARGQRLRGVFIHDLRNHTAHGDDSLWAGHRGELGITADALDEFECGLGSAEFKALLGRRIFRYGDYLQASDQAFQAGLIGEDALQTVRKGYWRDLEQGLCCAKEPPSAAQKEHHEL